MNYNRTSRRAVDKHIKTLLLGQKVTKIKVRSDIDLDIVSLYIFRRSPKTNVFRHMGLLNNTELILVG